MDRKKCIIALGARGPDFDEPANLSLPAILTEPSITVEGSPGWTVVCEIGEDSVAKLSQRDHILARIEAAKREILAADSMVQLMAFRNKVDAMRQLVRASRDMQLINLANELKLRCETQLGDMLRETRLSKGGRPSKTVPNTRNGFTLHELGIDKNLSSWVSAPCQCSKGQIRTRYGRGAKRRVGTDALHGQKASVRKPGQKPQELR